MPFKNMQKGWLYGSENKSRIFDPDERFAGLRE